jgi:transglutaminase-like putative cysteine protease
MIRRVRHATTYAYRQPVRFGEHHMMVRPRDSHDLRLIEATLSLSPRASVRWRHDVFNNSIATAEFGDAMASELRIESNIVIDHFGVEGPKFPIEPMARTLPFSYLAEEVPDLGRTIERHYPDPARKLDAWTSQFLNPSGPTDTDVFLRVLTEAIKAQFHYEGREEYGVQSPVETLERGSGTCRDFALLMMEAARSIGLAAGFVTGYLYSPPAETDGGQMVGAGATHAWAQVYLPGAG